MGLLGDLRLNYLPQSINASATAARNFSSTQQRSEQRLDDLEERAQFPIREQHSFTHRRNFSLQYNPFQFLNLSFDTSTNQSLNQIGVDTLITLIDFREETPRTFVVKTLDSEFYSGNSAGITRDDIGVTVFREDRLQVRPAFDALDGLLKNDPLLRTEQHDQRFNATFQPTFSRTGALNWITIQPITYSVQYGWQNGSITRPTGANVRNQVSLRSGVTLRPLELWRKIPTV